MSKAARPSSPRRVAPAQSQAAATAARAFAMSLASGSDDGSQA